MDDIDDDARYPPNLDGVSHRHQVYGYLNNQKLLARGSPYSQPVANEYSQDNNDEDGEDEEHLGEEEDEDVGQSSSVQLSLKDANDDHVKEDDTDGDGDENDDHDDKQKGQAMEIEDELEWHPKKRKLKSLISAYELAPRVPVPSGAAPSTPKPSFGGRNSLTDWTEHETFVLLDAWGDRFLQRGRKCLRSEEWQEVAEKVSAVSNIKRTDTQCRNRVDTLKKKYKKEKVKFPEMGVATSKWVYFERMDKLMPSLPQQAGLSCGLDSGEYVSVKPRVNLNRANGLDEMRDSPENTESTSEEDSDRPQAKKRKGMGNDEASSFRLLADSIHKFSKIYEKIENSKRQQMMELEKMRMDFHKELEAQKRQILERMQSEISKLEQRDYENDDSAENGM